MMLFLRPNMIRVAVALVFLGFSRSASAALVFGFSVDGGSTFVSSIETNIGSVSTIEVFIREIGAEDRLTTIGLVETGTRATFNTGLGDVLSVTIPTGRLAPNSGFSNASGFVLMESGFFEAAMGTSVKLGEFVYQANLQGSTEFRFGDANPLLSRSNFTLANGFDLDPELFGGDRSQTYNLTITAVPEPTLASLLPGAIGLLTLRRRGRRNLNSV